LVERTAFDHFCLQKAVAAGAAFTVVKKIDAVSENERNISLATDRGMIRARYLIGADGVHSRIRRLTGRFARFQSGFAVEGMLKQIPPQTLEMGFDFSQVCGGYGWVFPKKDHINVGLYSWQPQVSMTRGNLISYARRRLGGSRPVHITGYPLGMGGWRYRPGFGRTLLAGDAAGLVDPLLGEGLYHAIISGQQAAAAICTALDAGSDACQTYADRLRPLQRELMFSQLVATIFYRLPLIGYLLLTSPASRLPLMQGFAKGMPLLDIFCRGPRFWLGMDRDT
jgi:flavin-dependent dehydrogenase